MRRERHLYGNMWHQRRPAKFVQRCLGIGIIVLRSPVADAHPDPNPSPLPTAHAHA